MKIRRFILVRGDDWEGLYETDNGETYYLISEGHHIDLIGESKHEPMQIDDVRYADLDWLEGRGNYPYYLDDVKFE